MRLTTAPRSLYSPHLQERSQPSALRGAAGAGLAAVASVLLLLSPSLAVRHVEWSGSVPLPAERRKALEDEITGKPMMLFSQKQLERTLRVDSKKLRLGFERDLAGTLKVIVSPRVAAWMTEQAHVLDARGRVLDPSFAVEGLARLEGFRLEEDRGALRAEDLRLLFLLDAARRQTGLEWSAVSRRGEDLVLTLQPSKQSLWLDATHLEQGLRKLRMLTRQHDLSSLPPRIDLRFRDQIVLATKSNEVPRARP